MDWLPLGPAVVSAFPIMIAAKAPHPNAARLDYDSVSPKKDRRCSAACSEYLFAKMWNLTSSAFRGYKRVVENPEHYTDFERLVRLYNDILKPR